MKIAVFYNLHFGGAKRAVFEQVKRLKARGHTVDVYTTDPYEDIFNLKNVSNNYYEYDFQLYKGNVPILSRLIKDIDIFYKYKKIHKQIAEDIDYRSYDLVLCHPDVVTQAPYLLRYLKTKSAYYCQEPLRIAYEYVLRPSRDLNILNYIYEIITRNIRKRDDVLNARSSDFPIASCLNVRERMIQAYGIWPRVSYLGIDERKFIPKKISKKNQIIFFGNTDEPNSGYDLAKEAIRKLNKIRKFKLVIVPWRKNNSERLDDNALVKLYNESLLTLSVCRFENFGLTPLESMSCGIPVIATNVSGQRETVKNGIGGYLVDFDSEEIYKKIVNLVNNRKLLKEQGMKGREYIENNWTWDKRILELENMLVSFINDEKR